MPFRRSEPVASDAADTQSISALLKRLGAEAGELIRAELALAKLEMRDVVKQAALDGAKLGAAVVLAFVGALLLAAAAVLALGDVLGGHYATAALILGFVLLVAGALLARAGRRGLARTGPPQETVASLKEDGRLAARQLHQLKEEVKGADRIPPARPGTAHNLRGDDA